MEGQGPSSQCRTFFLVFGVYVFFLRERVTVVYEDPGKAEKTIAVAVLSRKNRAENEYPDKRTNERTKQRGMAQRWFVLPLSCRGLKVPWIIKNRVQFGPCRCLSTRRTHATLLARLAAAKPWSRGTYRPTAASSRRRACAQYKGTRML